MRKKSIIIVLALLVAIFVITTSGIADAKTERRAVEIYELIIVGGDYIYVFEDTKRGITCYVILEYLPGHRGNMSANGISCVKTGTTKPEAKK